MKTSAIAAALLALAPGAARAEAPAEGVVTMARGSVSIAGSGVAAAPASVLRRGDVVRTSTDGWAELHLRDDTRVRASAGTQVGIEGPDSAGAAVLALAGGRLWLELAEGSRGVAVRSGHVEVLAEGGASIVVDQSGGTATFVAVDRGSGAIRSGARILRIEAGRMAHATSAGEELEERTGGGAIAELVAAEARARRGDLAGIEAFLVAWARAAVVGPIEARGTGGVLGLDAEITGSDTRPAGFLIESALRPPPFFEEEVPPKGPNVEVEVTFGGE